MRRLLDILKKMLLWRYGRSTWQYDILCLLILAFIFLTPQRWFESSELRVKSPHQSPGSSLLILADARDQASAPDRKEVERRVRLLTNRPAAVVTAMTPRRDESGRVIAFEVDIR